MVNMLRLPDWLLDRLTPEPNTGCWLWLGSDSGNGYGKVSVSGHDEMVHRLVWELIVGLIPEGLQLDHRCRVRRCCYPGHLEPVTPRENTIRGDAVLYARAAA
jgi:hypothetical protein